ncbi:unnamed protein product [Didymodactylos carnosus]|uniref:Acid phosphatase n=1 Tax=Didymodactylos carnosus TaxID=1234261 RepID=A0A815IY33_9BILA|nr:unnamed protein product [Didymodactylos carnosus]CAF1371831.1 unnamed protein product [Didymodactylos carnosus]CAF4036387.1 unnamed protein product [Didymodactylos carnosus]CAF4258825.1 unnamed protein product [Didymodactylos carnosus]
MLLHIGDIAYAGVGSIQEGEMEFLWDEYMNQIQALATLMPYQVTVGNHEKYYNYTAFQFRFHMPKSNAFPSNFWYSMQWGSAYVIVISTEHDYTNGSEQFRFIEQELQKANDLKGRSVEWIIISGHRPFYCSDADELSQHTPGSPLLNTFEELFIKNRVDLVLGGHMHVYERAGPVFNGTQIAPPTIPNTYTNSPWPLYLTQGTGGIAVGEDKFINPSPEWSVVRYTHFGFGRLTFQEKDGNALLIYEYKANGNPTPLDSVTLVHTH